MGWCCCSGCGGLNLLFRGRVGVGGVGVGHMDMLGVKGRTQRGADSSEGGRKMAPDDFTACNLTSKKKLTAVL